MNKTATKVSEVVEVLETTHDVIPAKAGIQTDTSFPKSSLGMNLSAKLCFAHKLSLLCKCVPKQSLGTRKIQHNPTPDVIPAKAGIQF